MKLASETREGLKLRPEAWKGALESNGLKANIKKTKNDKKQKFQVSLTRKTSFLVLFAESIYTVFSA